MPRPHIHDPSMALPGPLLPSSEGGTTGRLLEEGLASSAKPNDGPGPTNRSACDHATDYPLARVLERFDDVREVKPGQYVARCPGHDDRKPSLYIREGDDGKVLVHCHSGCQPQAVLAAVGLKMRDLFPQSGNGDKGPPTARIEEVYPYVDEEDQLLFEVVRLKDPKDFLQRRPDGNGGHIWNVQGVRRILYRLLDLLETPLDRPVFVVEGEKDVDRLWELGIPATTNPGGALKWHRVEAGPLSGRPVIVIPDNHATGFKHADEVGRSLQDAAASVRYLLLPDLPEEGDVSDWLDAGGTADELWRLAEAAPEAMPEQLPSPSSAPLSQGAQGAQGGSGTLERNVLPCDKSRSALSRETGEIDAGPDQEPASASKQGGVDFDLDAAIRDCLEESPAQESTPASRWNGEAGDLDDVIRECLPPTTKTYREPLFTLARRLRFDPRTQELPLASMRPIVDRWYDQAAEAVGDKSKSEIWFEFTEGWDRVRHPVGVRPATQAFEELDDAPIPPCVKEYSDDPIVQALIRWCAQMQRMAGDGNDWPLGVDLMAHHLFGVPLDWRREKTAPPKLTKQWQRGVQRANRMMRGLMRDGVVERTLKVVFEPNPSRGKKACRYQFVKPLD